MVDLTKPKHTETAEEFLDYLRPSAPHWLGKELERVDYIEGNGWIFRGHSNECSEAQGFREWRLAPKAFRPGVFEDFFPNFSLKRNEIDKSERVAINNFLKLADRQGLVVLARDISHEWYVWSRNVNFSQDVEATALAQHHGVPTRLLDWTDSPLKAAYFASSGVENYNGREEPFVTVWAFRASLFEYLIERERAFLASERNYHDIKVIREKRYVNGYLSAQDGCFTLDIEPTHDMDYLKDYHLPERLPQIAELKKPRYVDELQESLINTLTKAESQFTWVHKITLPWSEVLALKKLLWYEQINPVSLMPTYDNVTATLRYKQDLFG